MKRFVISLFAFAVLSALLLAMLGLFMFHKEKTAYYRGLQLKPTDKYVVVGDSRSKQNINPELTKGLTNRSLGGSPWCVWKARMKDFMHLNDDGVKRIFIVEIYPRLLFHVRQRVPRECDYDKAFFWVVHPEMQEDVHFANVTWRFFQNMFPGRFLLAIRNMALGRDYPGLMNGGFGAPCQNGGYSERELSRLSDEQEELIQGYRFSAEDAYELELAVNLVRERGWDIVFVTFPTFPDVRARRRNDMFRNDLSRFCEKLKVRYFDLSSYGQDPAEWLDIAHERLSGSKVLWAEFSKRFNEWTMKQGKCL